MADSKVCGICGAGCALLYVHGFTEIAQHLAGAAPAGFLLIDVAGFAPDQFAVFKGHGAAADPLLAVAYVDMIEFGHGSKLASPP